MSTPTVNIAKTDDGWLARDVAASKTPEYDIFNGPCTLYNIGVDNTQTDHGVFYIKLYNNASPTAGTTEPDEIIEVQDDWKGSIPYPGGLEFDTALSMVCSKEGGKTVTDDPGGTQFVSVLADPS